MGGQGIAHLGSGPWAQPPFAVCEVGLSVQTPPTQGRRKTALLSNPHFPTFLFFDILCGRRGRVWEFRRQRARQAQGQVPPKCRPAWGPCGKHEGGPHTLRGCRAPAVGKCRGAGTDVGATVEGGKGEWGQKACPLELLRNVADWGGR